MPDEVDLETAALSSSRAEPAGIATAEPSPFVTGSNQASDRQAIVKALIAQLAHSESLAQLSAFAAQLLGTSSAHVALISDVQVVIGGVGQGSQAGTQTAVRDSICSLPVALGREVAIADATQDERVRAMASVTTGLVRAYIGVPLTVRGHVVGSLCVFDELPHEWTPADVDIITQLASPVVAELELAMVTGEYREDRLRWQLAIDAAEVGAFDWNIATDELRWDERLLDLFGLSRETFGGTIAAFSDCVYLEDRDRVTEALQEAVATCGVYAAEYRVVLPDGGLRWIRARGRAIAGPDGLAARVLGAGYDTTAVEEGEASVRRVLESMPTAFAHIDPDWRLSYVNGEARRILGVVDSEPVGTNLWELLPALVGSEVEDHYRGAVRTGQPIQFETFYPPPLDRWYEVRAWPTPDGLSVYFLDITERRNAHTVAERERSRRDLLASITSAVTETVDLDEAAARLAHIVVGPFADWSLVSLIDKPTATGFGTDWRRGLRDVAGWHADPRRRPLVDRYREVRMGALSDTSPVARALRAGDVVVATDAQSEPIASVVGSGEAGDLLQQLDPAAAVVLPLRGKDRTLGLLTVFRDEATRPFTSGDLELLQDVSARAGLALDNARLYGEQREVAEALQRSLLTEPPRPSYVDIAVRYAPAAETAQVGGDWYDALQRVDGSTVMAIGDVIGHDTAAAAAMAQVRGLLRGIAVTSADGPGGVLSAVDDAIDILQLDTTATAIVACLTEPEHAGADGTVRMVWSNAGHPPPVLVLPQGPGQSTGQPADQTCRATRLETEPQLLLGMSTREPRHETAVELPPGATVIMYTDGLVERRGRDLDDGIAELERLASELAAQGLGLEPLCDELLARLLPAAPDDDVALIAVRIRA